MEKIKSRRSFLIKIFSITAISTILPAAKLIPKDTVYPVEVKIPEIILKGNRNRTVTVVYNTMVITNDESINQSYTGINFIRHKDSQMTKHQLKDYGMRLIHFDKENSG